MNEISAWTILVLFLTAGLVGTLLPLVPGVVLILVGVLVFKLMLPAWLSWWTVGVVAALVLLERLVDFLGSVIGAKWLGATRWGLVGAMLGGIVGIFFGLPGLVVGPVAGAFVAEILFARRQLKPAAKAGFGAGLGLGIATLGRFSVGMLMIVVVLFDLVFVTHH